MAHAGSSPPVAAGPSPAPWRLGEIIAVAAVAAAGATLELLVAGRYGYQRDELYFIVCGQHLAFGYVDQPPLAPLLAKLSGVVFGRSLIGLRLIPACCLAFIVCLTAAIARRLGASRTGQLLAALACVTASEYIAAGHVLTTTILDYSFWALSLYFSVRLLEGAEPRWWLAIGVTVGVGLDAKWNIGFLAVGLLVGLGVSGRRRLLLCWQAPAAAAAALVLGSPDFIWQAIHRWPNLAVFSALQQAANHDRLVFWPVQVTYTGLALTPFWLAGLVWLLRAPAAERFRSLGLAASVVLLLVFLGGGKPYYCGGVFTLLFAAGGVQVGAWVAGRHARLAGVAVALALSGLLLLPLAVPVLPARVLASSRLRAVDYPADAVNWPALVDVVAKAYDSLPPADKTATAIVTGNYGDASALIVVGRAYGLPPVYSGQNAFWQWGPPLPAVESVLAVGLQPKILGEEFRNVRLAGVLADSGIGYAGSPVRVYFASGLKVPWRSAWARFKHYD